MEPNQTPKSDAEMKDALTNDDGDEPIIADEEPGKRVDMSVLESQAKRDVVICHDIREIQALFKQKNLMSGVEVEEKKETAEEANQPKEKTFHIPNSIFDGYEELHEHNEDEFEYLASEIVIAWLEKSLKINEETPEWLTAIGFPESVPALGRSQLHELANFFDLAHHTTGKRGGNRRLVVYPKTMFVEQQQKERERLIDERKKIREKYAAKTWLPEPAEHPVTFRDQVIRELWEERKGVDGGAKITSNMIGGLDETQIGRVPDAAELRKLVEKKRAQLVTLKETMAKKAELAKERMAQLKEEEAKYNALDADSKVVDAARAAMAEKYEDMDEETRNRLIEEQRKAQIEL